MSRRRLGELECTRSCRRQPSFCVTAAAAPVAARTGYARYSRRTAALRFFSALPPARSVPTIIRPSRRCRQNFVAGVVAQGVERSPLGPSVASPMVADAARPGTRFADRSRHRGQSDAGNRAGPPAAGARAGSRGRRRRVAGGRGERGGGWGTGSDLARGRASQTLVSAENGAGVSTSHQSRRLRCGVGDRRVRQIPPRHRGRAI